MATASSSAAGCVNHWHNSSQHPGGAWGMADDRTSCRWQRRSAGAPALRWAVPCAPVGASVAAAWAAHGQLLVLGLVSAVVVVLGGLLGP